MAPGWTLPDMNRVTSKTANRFHELAARYERVPPIPERAVAVAYAAHRPDSTHSERVRSMPRPTGLIGNGTMGARPIAVRWAGSQDLPAESVLVGPTTRRTGPHG